MRKSFWLAGAAILAVAFPNVASAASGYVGAGYDNGSLKLGGLGSADFDGWSADGAVAFDAGNMGITGLGVQIGASYDDHSFDLAGGVKSTEVDAHLYRRGATWQWGGGVAYTSSPVKLIGSTTIDTWAVAGEAKYFMPKVTLGGSVSYSDASPNSSSSDVTSWRGAADGTFFVTDNISLKGGLGYDSLDLSGTSGHAWDLSVGAEYQLSSVPISIYGGYTGDRADIGGKLDVDYFSIGARWNFGGGTLLSRNRSGANLDHLSGPYERIFGG